MFGHLLLPVHSGGIILLGGAGCATVAVGSRMPMPYSQDLSWCLKLFVWNLRLTKKRLHFILVSLHGLLSVIHTETPR